LIRSELQLKPQYYGSKDWANWVLRRGIATLKDEDRDSNSRMVEVLIWINKLTDYGFWWQAERLRNHLHRFYYQFTDYLQAEGLTPNKKVGGYSF
jgi:hypothetical protein